MAADKPKNASAVHILIDLEAAIISILHGGCGYLGLVAKIPSLRQWLLSMAAIVGPPLGSLSLHQTASLGTVGWHASRQAAGLESCGGCFIAGSLSTATQWFAP
ncbi:unnamed protein product [Symbiodinium microadriaticum]|nr:unnamed protein product [Symbiodinium microadriaticum]